MPPSEHWDEAREMTEPCFRSFEGGCVRLVCLQIGAKMVQVAERRHRRGSSRAYTLSASARWRCPAFAAMDTALSPHLGTD
jgi:hypothetical protein